MLIRYWLEFLKPFHKLQAKEIEALSLILYYEHELFLQVKEPELVNQLLFSTKTKSKIKKDLGGMNNLVFNNLLSQLRKKGVISKSNKINNALRPPIGESKDFKLVFNFEIDETDKGRKAKDKGDS